MALAVIIPVSVMIYSNSRVSDLSKKIDDLKTHLDDKIDNAFQHIQLLLKLHEAEHHKK